MIWMIKFTLFFSMSFILLSFEYDKKSFFDIIKGYTGPIGADIQRNISQNFSSSFSKSKGLLTGKPPQTIKDVINSSKSSLKK